MLSGDIQRSIDGVWRFDPDDGGRTDGALRPADRPRRPAARLREAARRGAHPQHGARAESPRRGVSGPLARSGGRHRRRRNQGAGCRPRPERQRRRQPPSDRRRGRGQPRGAGRHAGRTGRRTGGVRQSRRGGPRPRHPSTACCERHRTSTVLPTSRSPDSSANGAVPPCASTTTPRAPTVAEWQLGAGPRVRQHDAGHARHRHRWRARRQRRRACAGMNGFAGEFGHMVGRPGRTAMPVRSARMLGAVRVGLRAGDARPRGRDAGIDSTTWFAMPAATRGGAWRARPGRRPRRRPRGARGDRRLRPLGRARPVEPHQRLRSGDVRARWWSRVAGPISTSNRSCGGTASCCTSRICGRCRASSSPSWAPLAGAVGAALLPTLALISAG